MQHFNKKVLQNQLIKKIQVYDKEFVEDYIKFGSQARAASIWALRDKYYICKSKENINDAIIFLPLLLQEFYMLFEQLEAVAFGFIKLQYPMLYILLTYDSNPSNFELFINKFMKKYKKIVLGYMRKVTSTKKIDEIKVERSIHNVELNLIKIAGMSKDLRSSFNKIKHHFVVVSNLRVFKLDDTDYPGIIHSIRVGNELDYSISDINFTDDAVERINKSTHVAVSILNEILLAYMLVKYPIESSSK